MNISATKLVAIAACGAALCGCITEDDTVYHNPDRVKIEFENDAAARIFYQCLSEHGGSDKTDSTTTVRIPVVFKVHHRVVDGESVGFNEAVRECDTNQDGKITEMEARIYAEHKAAQKKH